MVAVKNNFSSIVKLLVQEGNANQDIADKFGKKAIDKATSMEMFEILQQINSDSNEVKTTSSKKSSIPSLTQQTAADSIIAKVNITKILEEDFKNVEDTVSIDFGEKLREKLQNQLLKVGVRAAEKNLEELVSQIEEKVKKSEDLLIQKTNGNLKIKYDKFIGQIEKFASLKLKLLINQLFVPNTLSEEVEVPLANLHDLQIDQSCPQILQENLGQTQSTKESDDYALPPRPTTNSTFGIALTSGHKGKPSSIVSVPQETDFDGLQKTESQILSEEYGLPDYSAKKLFLVSPQIDRTTTLSPSTEGKNRSASKVFDKPSDKLIIKLLSNQSDRLVQSIKENTTSIVEEIMEDKFEAIQKVVLAEMSRIINKKAQEIKEQIEEKYEDCLKYQKFLIHYAETLKPKMIDAQLQAYIPEPQVIVQQVEIVESNTQESHTPTEYQQTPSQNKMPAPKTTTGSLSIKETNLRGRKDEFINKKINEYLLKPPSSEKSVSPKTAGTDRPPYQPFSSLLKKVDNAQRPKTEASSTIERSPRFAITSVNDSEEVSDIMSRDSLVNPQSKKSVGTGSLLKGTNQSLSFFIPSNPYAKPSQERKSTDETHNPSSLNLSQTANTSFMDRRDILKESNLTSETHSHRDDGSNRKSVRRRSGAEGKENSNEQENYTKQNSWRPDEKTNGIFESFCPEKTCRSSSNLSLEKNLPQNQVEDLTDTQARTEIVKQLDSAFEKMAKLTSFPPTN